MPDEPILGQAQLAVAEAVPTRLIRLEGGRDCPRDIEFTPWKEGLRPGTGSGTYFKSVRVTDDGREIWTHGGVDEATLAAGFGAGGRRLTSTADDVSSSPVPESGFIGECCQQHESFRDYCAECRYHAASPSFLPGGETQ